MVAVMQEDARSESRNGGRAASVEGGDACQRAA